MGGRLASFNEKAEIDSLKTAISSIVTESDMWLGKKNIFPISSLISPSFQGDPTIFQKGIFLKQTPHIKN